MASVHICPNNFSFSLYTVVRRGGNESRRQDGVGGRKPRFLFLSEMSRNIPILFFTVYRIIRIQRLQPKP
jgi:hypothetical protein